MSQPNSMLEFRSVTATVSVLTITFPWLFIYKHYNSDIYHNYVWFSCCQRNLMEGLICSRIIPIRAYGNQGNTPLFPTYTSSKSRIFYGPIRMMGPSSTSSNSKAGSIKPLAASSSSIFDNTLPSKGIIYFIYNIFHFLLRLMKIKST